MAAPELLEAIISLLPVRDIFANAQRVSRTWNAVAQLPSVQTRLWMRAPTEDVASPFDYLETNSISSPPSLHLPSYMPVYSVSVAHNPTRISRASGYGNVKIKRFMADATYCRASLAIPRTSSDLTRPTWFDMQLTEPRITTVQLHVQQPSWGLRAKKYNGTWVSVREDDGLTFGKVLTVAQKVCGGFPVNHLDRDQACVVIWFLTGQ